MSFCLLWPHCRTPLLNLDEPSSSFVSRGRWGFPVFIIHHRAIEWLQTSLILSQTKPPGECQSQTLIESWNTQVNHHNAANFTCHTQTYLTMQISGFNCSSSFKLVAHLPFSAITYFTLHVYFRKITHLNLGSCLVIIPTSSSEGLKSMDRTVDRHEIAVCCKTRWKVVKKHKGKERRGNKYIWRQHRDVIMNMSVNIWQQIQCSMSPRKTKKEQLCFSMLIDVLTSRK